MIAALWLVPILPLAGFLALALLGPRLGDRAVAAVGVGSVFASSVLCLLVSAAYLSSGSPAPFRQELWSWMRVDAFSASIAFHLDALSLVMALVVTFVGFVIHAYSVEYMRGEEGYHRFFASMNLFVASMLTLVLADDLLLLYLGWEGVGLCSYLLIGFWYADSANGRAAQKAFIVTRVGDAAFAVALFALFHELGTLRIDALMERAAQHWRSGAAWPIATAALLLGGAVGKSAQLPLQTWLPDAMAGPTPVSALIHAATMVTAGVYLIARTHTLFELAPPVMLAVAIVGAATLLLAGCSALVQRDIKRVLAYSTISQIGYMFLALGVGAWSAAIFHFMTHAFFKALLFLAAGAVILAAQHEQDMFKMGGLRTRLPLVFWPFLIGAASLSGFPLVTAGFYSKDLIILSSLAAPGGSGWLFAAALAGSLLTSLYAFRLIFLVFFGPAPERVAHRPGPWMTAPLLVLSGLALVAGFVWLPPALGNTRPLARLLEQTLPAEPLSRGAERQEGPILLLSALVSLLGIFLAYWTELRRRRATERVAAKPAGAALQGFLRGGWGFDALYDSMLVRPYVWFARADRDDVVDLFYRAVARATLALHMGLSRTVSGNLRQYAAAIAAGAAVLIALAVFT
jgi:NADH-quinone oxidoreductase subunit L